MLSVGLAGLCRAEEQPPAQEPAADPRALDTAEETPVTETLAPETPETEDPETEALEAEAEPAESPPPTPGERSSQKAKSNCDRTRDLEKSETAWYDSAHAYMNTAFCEPAVWFDDFFASDRVLEEVGGSYVRWRNDYVQTEGQGADFNTNLNFSIELPKISSKLKLIFEGDEDQDLQDLLPGGQAEGEANNLGLRLDVKDTDRSKFNISVSAKPRIRLRYRYTLPVRDDFLIRFTQEIQNEEGVNGARSRLDFEKAFLPLKLFRATTEAFWAEDFPGADLSQAFTLFQRITRKSSVSYEASAIGITQPEAIVTSYRLGIRYRQNIHRDWLFFEVSPDVTWPISLSEDREEVLEERRSVYSILVRVEVHFGNAKRRKYSDYY